MRIVASDLAAGFRGRPPILSGLDLALGPGEIVGLIGPNGSGKTTLLRTLAGLVAPLGGDLRYDGSPRSGIGARALSRRLAYLAQGEDVHWSLTVEALVALGRLPHRGRLGVASPADREAVDRALASVDATAFRDREIGTLSGGERRRVLLARALAVEAEVLLADEPIAALDPLHQLGVMGLLADAARGGTGVVVVLHDLSIAARFCDRLVLLSNGRIAADGGPDDVLTDRLIASAYGVEVARGRHGGRPFLVPWAPVAAGAPREP